MSLVDRFLEWIFGPTPTPPPSPPPAPLPVGDLVAAMAVEVNVRRAMYARPPLAIDGRLVAFAQEWADEMATTRLLTHGDFSRRLLVARLSFSAAAENIADGQANPSDVAAGWMASPPHQDNMLGNYALLGVGHAIDGAGVPYWSVVFAA